MVGCLIIAASAACLVPGHVPCPPRPFCPPPLCYEYRTVTKYRTEHRTEYRDVSRPVTRRVPEVVMKEVQETVSVPHWRDVTRQRCHQLVNPRAVG